MTKEDQSLKNACDYLLDSVEGFRNENGKLLMQIENLKSEIESRNIQINTLSAEAYRLQAFITKFFNQTNVDVSPKAEVVTEQKCNE